jgi:hypothetical protein
LNEVTRKALDFALSAFVPAGSTAMYAMYANSLTEEEVI